MQDCEKHLGPTAAVGSGGDPSPRAAEFLAALSAGDLDRADGILPELGSPLTGPPLRAAAELHLHRRRWQPAAALFEQFPRRTDVDGFKLHLARNLASLQQHRPRVYQTLSQLVESGRYQIFRFPTGQFTITLFGPQGTPMMLSPGGSPQAGLDNALRALQDPIANGTPLGVIGVADGYLLARLAQIQPRLFLDQQLPVHVAEPDAERLLYCLMIHDYSGSAGPIEQPRFQWHIGRDWAAQYHQALIDDPFLPPLQIMAQQGVDDPGIDLLLKKINQELTEFEHQQKRRVYAYYARQDDQALLALLGEHPPRRPRALLLTSRFTTVLQYMVRDMAAALEQLGWQTRLLLESQPHHRLSRRAIGQALERFQPDVVFTMDHLRREDGENFPPHLPYVSWIQDHLENLLNRQAGQSLTRRDLVMLFDRPLFVEDYGYHDRQCLDVPMMMVLPPPPETPQAAADHPTFWTSAGDDLAYVSNVSQPPALLAEKTIIRLGRDFVRLGQSACPKMLDLYQRGQTLPTQYAVRRFLEETLTAMGEALPTGANRQKLVEIFWNPLNIGLYRQQALRWVAAAARNLGLKLALYGRGWENNPAFAEFARGSVQPGRDLNELYRRTKINLNLEPYPCIIHNRMSAGLAAGGFFLVREHPENALIQEIANFLDEHLDAAVEDSAGALAAAPAALRPRLQELLERGAILSFADRPDPVRQVRCYQRAQVVARQDEFLPHLRETSFHDSASCAQRIAQYLPDAAARQRIAVAQWANIRDRLSIVAGMQRVVTRLAELIAEEQQQCVAV